MTTEHKDFEVISNSDTDMGSESSDNSIQESKVLDENDPYSQDDRTFMFELYRENRDLLKQISEKEKKIAKLEERNIFLSNSNMFWLYCYIGTAMTTLFSLVHR